MKTHFCAMLAVIFLLRAGAEDLDPSIFDGSKIPPTGEKSPPPSPGTNGEAGEESPALPEGPLTPPAAEGEGTEAGGETGLPGTEAAPSPSPTPAATTDAGGTEAGEGEKEGEVLESGPAAPGEIPGSGSRAGETFRPSERIAPDHAVDLPWDI